MADAPNDPTSQKLDLKARLGLKTRAAAPPPAAPIVPGVLPPPDPVKKAPEKPTAETIAEARQRAAEADAAAGPAVERFSFVSQDNTPAPGPLPSGPQVKYVEVAGSEELPEVAKKRRIMLIGAVLVAAAIAFLLGRTLAGSSAQEELREQVIAEAKAKQQYFIDKQPTFDLINNFRDELGKIDTALRLLDPATGDIMTLEKELTGLLSTMTDFAANGAAFLNPDEAMGDRILNGALMRQVVDFAFNTKAFHEDVLGAIEEAKALFSASPIPPADRQTLLLIAEPDTRDVEGLGPVPLSKGTIVIQPGPPQPYQSTDAAGNPVTKFQQKVRVEGRADPVQIETTQLVQADMQPFYNTMAKNSKRKVLERLAVIASRLFEQSKRLDAKPVRTEIERILDIANKGEL